MKKEFPVVKISDTLSVVVDKKARIGIGDKVYSFGFIKTVKSLFTAIQTSAGDNIPSVRYQEEDESHQWAEIHCIVKIIATVGERILGIPQILIPGEGSYLAQEEFPNWYTEYDEGRAYKGFLRGWKAAKSKETYTEDDIKTAFNKGSNSGAYHMKRQLKTGELTFKSGEEYLQSLQKKEIKSVILELEVKGHVMGKEHWVDGDFAEGYEEDVRKGNIEGTIPGVKETRVKINPDDNIIPLEVKY